MVWCKIRVMECVVPELDPMWLVSCDLRGEKPKCGKETISTCTERSCNVNRAETQSVEYKLPHESA